jgi:protein TonB
LEAVAAVSSSGPKSVQIRTTGRAGVGEKSLSYAQRKSVGGSRTFAIAIVALTQAAIGYAIVTGLAYTTVGKAPGSLKTFNVVELQPPPPEFRPAPKKIPETARRVAPPQPVVREPALTSAPAIPGPSAEVLLAAAPTPPAAVDQEPPPPPPPAIEPIRARSATGDLQRLFRPGDYPIDALKRREQGAVTVQLTIGATGRVGACDVTSSSGSKMLDRASCRIILGRALFTPARDNSGHLTTDTVHQEIRWVLS